MLTANDYNATVTIYSGRDTSTDTGASQDGETPTTIADGVPSVFRPGSTGEALIGGRESPLVTARLFVSVSDVSDVPADAWCSVTVRGTATEYRIVGAGLDSGGLGEHLEIQIERVPL